MKRYYHIDALRIISAIAVVVIHIVASPISNSPVPVDEGLVTILGCIQNLSNWAVPVFFMITGYCILNKTECTYRYCFSRSLKYVYVLLTVGFGFALMEEFVSTKAITLSLFTNSLYNVVSGNLWDHMWFVYAIIGIYWVLPVIHGFMKTGKNNRLILTGLLFFFTIGTEFLKHWVSIGIDFPFGGFLFYVCFGGLIAKGDLGRPFKWGAIVAGAAAVVWILLHPDVDFSYYSLPVCAMAVAVFVVGCGLPVKENKLLLAVSQCTWGIYLLHPLFINIAFKVLHIDLLSYMPYVTLPVFGIVLFLVSFAVTFVLRKIPVVKTLF